jgi:hypothetical protein
MSDASVVLDQPKSYTPPATVSRGQTLSLYGGQRTLVRAFADARLALGERMYAAAIDDGKTGQHIAATDEVIRRALMKGKVHQHLEAERKRLLLQLADAALEDDAPLPGADAEYAEVRKILATLLDPV